MGKTLHTMPVLLPLEILNPLALSGPQLRVKFCRNYEVAANSLLIPEPNRELRVREQSYGTFRPHQALHYLTPQEFVAQWKKQPKPADCH